jgi:hypothetical protein
MRAVFIFMTAATFLAHALLGCCWHHAHAAGRPGGTGSAACGHSCGCTHDSAHPDDPSSENEPPASPSECDEPGCVFVSPAPVAAAAETPFESWLVSDVVAVEPLETISLAQIPGSTRLADHRGDSLRLHLALGVLRI